MKRGKKAFTLIEVLAALAIVSLAVVALIRLQLYSVRMVDHSESQTLAALLAREKTAQIQSCGFCEPGEKKGTDPQNPHLKWKTTVSPAKLPDYPDYPDCPGNNLNKLRRIDVQVTWGENNNTNRVQIIHYVADNP